MISYREAHEAHYKVPRDGKTVEAFCAQMMAEMQKNLKQLEVSVWDRHYLDWEPSAEEGRWAEHLGESRVWLDRLSVELGKKKMDAKEIERCCQLAAIPLIWMWGHAKRYVQHYQED